MANVTKALQELDNVWTSSETIESQGFTPLPDGNYSGKLVSGTVEMSQNGRVQIVWVLKVSEGKYSSKVVKKFDGIDNEVSIGYAKGLMKVIGISIPSSVAKLPKSLEGFFSSYPDGVNVEFTVKTKDGYVNIYINSVSAGKDEGSKKPSKPDSQADEKPKTSSKKLLYTDLEDMDKDELIKLIEKRSLDIDDADKLKEAKLRRLVAEELDIDLE